MAGMIDFFVPIIIAIFAGNKWFCNRLCGRGQLFSKLGGALKFFGNRQAPRWLVSKWFQIWFSCIFPCHVFKHDIPDLFGCIKSKNTKWSNKAVLDIRSAWRWTYKAGTVPDWIAQFSFGFYGLMLTSMLIGLVVMVLYKPRTWCVFCPMGTMTQSICKLKHRSNLNKK